MYKVGLYLRLSKDDNNALESASIKNQRMFLLNYAKEHNFFVTKIYVDDGFSGTDFNRPDFQNMIKDIENGIINMVITKDLSRLGRDYIETGYYIEKYFPTNKIRYIAVNDNIDTYVDNSVDISAFKNVINDMYAKDISKKVITSLRTKAKDGKFIGSIAPYGYKKSDIDKNLLVINNDCKYIVENIFDNYIKGKGYSAIANDLNDKSILSPSKYNEKTYGIKNYNSKKGLGLWNADYIRKILINPVYIGHMCQHKSKVINYKVHKKVSIPNCEQIIVLNTHEPIILESTFYKVQDLISKKSNYTSNKSSTSHALSGIIFCGLCGSRLTFSKENKGSKKGEFYLICSNYKRFSNCKRNIFYEKDLENIIVSNLKVECKRINQEDITFYNNTCDNTDFKLNNYLKREIELSNIIKSLYEDKINNIITIDFFNEYLEIYLKEKEQIQKDIDEIKKITNSSESVILNKELIFDLIEKIEVYEDKISIYYKFLNSAQNV